MLCTFNMPCDNMRLDTVKFYFGVYCLLHITVSDPVYVSSPGVVRGYPGESATFLWTLDTPFGDNWFTISFYYESTTQSIYSRAIGTSGGWAPDYENRANATFQEDDVSLGFTLYRISEGDINYPYECYILLMDGSRVRNNTATLFIFGPPITPTLTPAPPAAVENTEFSLTCSTTTTSVPAGLLPVMTYTWTRDGDPLPTDRHSTRGDHGQELVIDTVQREDHQKVYRCQVRETGSKLSNFNQLTLDVQYGPAGISLSDPGPITVVEGDHVTVTCTSDCRPGCDYVWTGPGVYRHEGSNLSFQSINRDRHGTYTCQSSNDHGSESTELSVTVNFAPTITSFGHSQGDISRGGDVTLTCSVDSRPDSTIRISNSTSELDPTIRRNTAEYRFNQPVMVLDSGAYFCSASNGVEPNPDDQQLTMDVKGGFLPCNNQSITETRGATLNDAFEETICLIANPFPVISRGDWMFLPSNDTRTDTTLPADVVITVETTEHVYQKITLFRVPSVSVSHYGTYTMTADNGEGQALVFTVFITPDGPPEAPTHLICTDTTAVSLLLQWTAGDDGGADQTFVVTYTDTESGTANVVEIDGSGTPRGALVSHRLTDTQHILPDTTYLIRIDARNKNGKTGGPAITNRTLAQPGFVGDPTILIEGDTALVTWPISNPKSVTHILVQVCDSDKANICNITTVWDVSVQPYIVALPDASSFQFTFDFYDGVEIVNNVTYAHDTGGKPASASMMFIIVGTVVGFAVVMVVVVVLVLWRKGLLSEPKMKADYPHHNVHYENTTAVDIGGNEIPDGEKVDIQYEDVDVLTADISKTTGKMYEGLIGAEIHKVPTVYTTVRADRVSLAEYRPSDIRPGDVISRGAVFCVQAAVILKGKHNQKARNVVIKQILSCDAEIYQRYLLEAAQVILRLNNCQHVVHCAGTTPGSLLMENVPMGNLRQYLRGMADHEYANTADSIQQECNGYIEQIIHGVEAVLSLQPPALFYCLSADHVILGQGQICKLIGFNTAESVRQREQWEQEEGTDRPVGWLAPEAVDLQHVQKSDIWGLGVLLWEIVELGRMPYQGMDERRIIEFILQGDRLKVAPACTSDIRDVISSCWLHNPDSRRSIGEITTMLGMTSA